ncbi:ATP synthase subunit delta, mitochondrial [Myotis davidii]|uniref:ATP synthase F(1) complex subunit delta, mitochondrial n=1 Tax=Myotis davidii TaxID=225400 RepID=L5LTT2_MYODS|nr:ATP synthase subunit delta, mitochondrial [Myotis davidii]
MLPAALLRRPGLGRLVRQARAYAEAAAAPAPAAGPGQMSFTFASPTQVRTPFRTPGPGRNLLTSIPNPISPSPRSPIPIRYPQSETPNPQVADPYPVPLHRVVWGPATPNLPNSRTYHLEFDTQGPDMPFKPGLPLAGSTPPEISTSYVPFPGRHLLISLQHLCRRAWVLDFVLTDDGTEVFFNGANVRQVDVPTQTGAFGILAAHVPTLQVLRPGLVVVHAEDGTTSKYFVSSGSVTVNADSSVQLLAEEAVSLDMLDLGAAKANLEKAQSELSGASDEAMRAEIQIRIEANEALVKALDSGSVTVNADSSVQLLAEEAVSLDMLDLGAAKANLEKAQSELSGASDEAMRAEIQIRIEANEALVKALE